MTKILDPFYRDPSCFYLILANLNYFNLSSVFILPLLMFLNLSLPFLFLSDTNRCCADLPRMSARAYGSI